MPDAAGVYVALVVERLARQGIGFCLCRLQQYEAGWAADNDRGIRDEPCGWTPGAHSFDRFDLGHDVRAVLAAPRAQRLWGWQEASYQAL